MKIKLISSDNDQIIRQLSIDCLEHHLHYSKDIGVMYYWFNQCETSIICITVAYNKNNIPVAAGVISTTTAFNCYAWGNQNTIAIFVKEEYRKQGIGYQIAQKLKEISPVDDFVAISNSIQGIKLFQKAGIKNDY